MKITLNVKNMKNTYMNAKSDMPTVWEAFYTMHCMNYISREEWEKFYKKCAGWSYDKDLDAVVDYDTGKVIHYFED